MLYAYNDLLAFDRMAAGSGGWFKDGSWIFHARRSHRPSKLGVTGTADVVVANHFAAKLVKGKPLDNNNVAYKRFCGTSTGGLRHRQDRAGSRRGGGRKSAAEGAMQRALAAVGAQQAIAAAVAAQEAAAAAVGAQEASPPAPADEHCFWCARAYYNNHTLAWHKADGRRWCDACRVVRIAALAKGLDVYDHINWSERPAATTGACPNDGVGGGCSACILPV